MTTHYPPVTIPQTEVHVLSSAHIDHEFSISVALPPGHAKLKLSTHTFEGESHISVMSLNLSRGIRAVFQ